MKTKILLLGAFFLFMVRPATVAAAFEPSEDYVLSPYIPHVDRVFLHAHELGDQAISAMIENLKPFCSLAASASASKRARIDLAALESCQLAQVVQSLKDSEAELDIRSGEPFMMRAQVGPVNEPAVWRYFIRTQKARRLLSSLRVYYSHSGGIQNAYVGLVGIPTVAGALDNYSYWTRLIAMEDSSYCPVTSGGPAISSKFCHLVQPQLLSLASKAWRSAKIPDDLFALDEKNLHLLTLAGALRERMAVMTLDELNQLENMQDVTSAGLGIPYFRQLMARLQIDAAALGPESQQKLQKAVLLAQIREALKRWDLPATAIGVEPESILRLANELTVLIK